MKVMPAHRARMVDAGSALVVSGGDKSGWNSGWPGMGEPTRMVKGLDSEVWVRESQGVPKAQEAPFDPIPSGGDIQSPFFLSARQLSFAIWVASPGQNLAPDWWFAAAVLLSHLPTARVRHLPYCA